MPLCHVCTSPRSEPVVRSDEGNLAVNRCLSCGFAYLASWERSIEQARALYDYYGQLDDEDFARRYSAENRARQQKLLKELAAYTGGRRLLDVGCGDGQLLETAGDQGWDALGIDLSESAISCCHRRGLPASRTDFFDDSLDAQRFDVIVMSELIEHVPSPQRFLKRAETLLDHGGVVYLTTPNFGSLARRMLGGSWSVIHPEHIGYFERSSIRKLASEQTGLLEIKIDANNITPSTLVAWLRRSGSRTVTPASQLHRETRQSLDQELRRAVHKSRVLGISKEWTNRAISRLGLGDTLVAWLQKPASQR